MASIANIVDLIQALIDSSREEGKLERVIGELEAFFNFMVENDEIRKTLTTPAFPASVRKEVMADMCRALGFDTITAGFLGLALELGRLKALIDSKEPVLRKLRRASGISRAEVILADTPSAEDTERIKGAIERQTPGRVEVVFRVDPDILGGVIVKIEDRLYDGSLKTQLDNIKGMLSRLV